jgi:tetratricopeptide (TPR) repeat protein
MLTRRWFLCLLFALSLLPTAQSVPPLFAGESQWVEVRSPNFSVITDAGEHRGREVALRFEQMRAAFGTLITKAKVNIPVPLQIVAFRNTKEMRQVAPLFHGKPTQVAGLFQGGADRSFIMLDMSTENPWTTVFHEYAHQLMNGNMQAETDPWFEEGFAEYFSSIEADGKEVRVGKILHNDYLILQQVGMMKVADLFRVQHYSETYNENGNSRTTFYVESGMLMHYIYDEQLLERVAVYFDLKWNKHLSVEDAVQQAFAISAAQLDKELRNYISAGRYRYYPLPAAPNISDMNYTSKPLSVSDANAVLADIHLHSPDYQDRAITEFQAILKSDPNNAGASRGLGYAYLQKQDYAQAGEYFKKASEQDSKDPRVHYYNALLMARERGFSSRVDIPALTKELETAINLDPNFADSYALLSFAQSTSGDQAKALQTMTKAISIDPRNEDYRFNIASIYMASQQPDKAIAILESLQKSTTNPEMASRIGSVLDRLREFQEERSRMTEAILSQRPDSDTPGASEEPEPAPATPPANGPKWGAPIFLRGTIRSVDCSAVPSAVLTVVSGSKTIQVKIADKAHVILIGADEFSCSWGNKKAAVNYRQNEKGDTNVMSVELQ